MPPHGKEVPNNAEKKQWMKTHKHGAGVWNGSVSKGLPTHCSLCVLWFLDRNTGALIWRTPGPFFSIKAGICMWNHLLDLSQWYTYLWWARIIHVINESRVHCWTFIICTNLAAHKTTKWSLWKESLNLKLQQRATCEKSRRKCTETGK